MDCLAQGFLRDLKGIVPPCAFHPFKLVEAESRQGQALPVLGPHLLYLPLVPSHHYNLWPLPWGSLALVSCVYTVPFLLVKGGGCFSLNRGYTYVLSMLKHHHVLDIGFQ